VINLESSDAEAEVIAGGGEHGIGGVAACVGEVIAAHAAMFFEMADDGLNGGTPFELALDLRRDAARRRNASPWWRRSP
jgi:hypothetical protein